MQRSFKVDCAEAFPFGLFRVGVVTPIRDFDKSSKEREVQAVDETGSLMWSLEVIDGDPEARQRTLKVKIAAPVKPMLPDSTADEAFSPISFDGLMVTPYIDTNGPRPKMAMSFKATGIAAAAKRKPTVSAA